jgi:AraC-like DNA-binding protein
MILRRQSVIGPLGDFVDFFWYYKDLESSHAMEHVLPDGTFELIINLRDAPRKLFDRNDTQRYTLFQRGWLSGAHSRYIVIDALPGSSLIGAHFKPGGITPFLGISADEFRDQVVPMEALWGSSASKLRERLLTAQSPAAKFRVLEGFLTARLRCVRPDQRRHERIAWAVRQFCREPHLASIGSVAHTFGITHKHFISEFRDQVGLTPKLFCRIQRFQRVLAEIASGKTIAWADIACGCGYYDQAHFVNDFQNFAGLNPSAYLNLGAEWSNFVPVLEAR